MCRYEPIGRQYLAHVILCQPITLQGVSHWAPANIGPYSQGVTQQGHTLLSGSIALVPGTMTLLTSSDAGQASMALRHVSRVARVLSRVSLDTATRVVCYVTSTRAAQQADHVWRSTVSTGVNIEIVMVSQLPRGASVGWELELHQPEDNCDNEA